MRDRIVLAIGLLLALLAPGTARAEHIWQSVSLYEDIGVRYAFAVDGIHRYAYAFGPQVNSVATNSLYRQDLDDPRMSWDLLTEATPKRTDAKAFFDHARGRLLVLGGLASAVPPSDIWTWDPVSNQWSQPPVTGTPPSTIVTSFPLTYDSRRDRLLYVNNQGISTRPAVWALELGGDTLRWSRLPIAGTRPLFPGAAAAYDSLGDRLFLLQAGVDSLRVVPADSAGTFAAVQVEPFYNDLPSLCVDLVHRRLVIVSATYFSNLNATLRTVDLADLGPGAYHDTVGQPVTNQLRAWAEDPIRHELVAMGWSSSPLRSVLPTEDAALAWITLRPEGIPYTHRGMAGANDPVGRWLYVYGGESDEQSDCASPPCLSQKLHRVSLDDPTAHEEVFPAGPSPGPRTGMSAVYDSTERRIVFYGGEAPGHVRMQDCWALDLVPEPHWSSVATDVPGPVNLTQAAAFDDARRRMYIVSSTPSLEQPLWRLNLAQEPAVWTHLPWTVPHGSTNMLGYDPERNRILGVGHLNGMSVDSTGVADSVDAGTPGGRARVDVYGTFDPTRNYLLAYGGWARFSNTGTEKPRQALAFGGASFLDLQAALSSPIPPDANGLMVYDRVLDRVLVLNGEAVGIDASGYPALNAMAGVWTLALDASVPILPGPVSATLEGGVVRVRFFGHVDGFVHVDRSGTDGAWNAVGEASAIEPGFFEYLDREVTPGERYRYRFRWFEDGSETMSAPTDAITVPVRRVGALSLAFEGGAVGRGWPLVAHVTLDRSGPAELALFDVTGRCVSRARFEVETGVVTTKSLTPVRTAPGVFFVRLVSGDATLRTRIVRF